MFAIQNWNFWTGILNGNKKNEIKMSHSCKFCIVINWIYNICLQYVCLHFQFTWHCWPKCSQSTHVHFRFEGDSLLSYWLTKACSYKSCIWNQKTRLKCPIVEKDWLLLLIENIAFDSLGDCGLLFLELLSHLINHKTQKLRGIV